MAGTELGSSDQEKFKDPVIVLQKSSKIGGLYCQRAFFAFPSRAGARVSINSSLYLHGFKTGSSGRGVAPFLVTMAATINVILLEK